ncbi:MAG TPA: proline racemase family protein [Candidatus Binatia bacterium]|nr:proline racemase family protein [Candidatus Binatia bacterium]
MPHAAANAQAIGEVACVDYHTAGEPFRIVTSSGLALEGNTVADRRLRAIADPQVNAVRRLLCHEPRGHADMYGCFPVPADDDGASLGVLFWHKDGFSTACGHGTIALGVWASESGRVASDPDGETEIRIDVPSGRVSARVRCAGGAVRSVVFRNVPSFLIAPGVDVSTPRGPIRAALSFGGAIYATVRAESLGLAVTPDRLGDLITIGREIKRDIENRGLAQHPTDPRLSGLYGTIFYDDMGSPGGAHHQRNVTIFADGEVDRSPCGSGTAARVAQLVAEGQLALGQEFVHESIIGTQFRARAVQRIEMDGIPAVVPEVEGMAFRTGEHRFVLDANDPLGPGFVLR